MVMVAVSNSDAAWKAVEHAIDLAHLIGAPLLAAHVVNTQSAFRTGIYYRTALRELSEEGIKRLKRAQSMARSRGVDANILQLYGSQNDALIHLAKSVNPRVVVLYKESPSLLDVILRRSLAEQMLRNVKCPLYLVGAADAGPIYWRKVDPSLIVTATLRPA
jgi:nucleotide-binding universal stress UspA family protein